MRRRRLHALSIVVCLCLILVASAQAPPQVEAQAREFDYILLVDTSGSMECHGVAGPCKPIFEDLQRVLKDFVRELPNGVNVILLPFDGGVDPDYLKSEQISKYKHISDGLKGGIYDDIDGLKPDGRNTYIWDSLGEAVTVMEELRLDGAEHFQLLLLVTDGRDEGSQRSASDVLGDYEMHQVANPYMYGIYVALRGQPVPTEIEESLIFQSWTTEGVPPSIQLVLISPLELDYGSLLEAEEGSRSLVMWYNDPELEGLPIVVGAPATELSLPQGATLNLRPREFEVGAQTQSLVLSLVNWPPEAQDVFTGTISLEDNKPEIFVVPHSIPFQFNTFPPCQVRVSTESRLESVDLGFLGTYPRDGIQFEALSEAIILSFSDCPAETSIEARAEIDDAPSGVRTGQHVQLKLGDQTPQGSVQLNPAADEFHVRIGLDQGALKGFPSGETTVVGQVLLKQSAGDRSVVWDGVGQSENGDWLLGFEFRVSVVRPAVTVTLEDETLGRAGPDPFATTVRVSCDEAAQNAGMVVRTSLVPADSNRFPLRVSDQMYLLSRPGAEPVGELVIDCAEAAEHEFQLLVAESETLAKGLPWNWPWQAHSFGGSLLSSSDAEVEIRGEDLAFSFEAQVPMPTGLIALLALVAAAIIVLIGLVLYSLLRPKFPHGLTVSVDGGPKIELRKLQGKGLFKRAVTVGSKRDDLNIDEGKTVGNLLPRRAGGCYAVPITDQWFVGGERKARGRKFTIPGTRGQVTVHQRSLRLESEIKRKKKGRQPRPGGSRTSRGSRHLRKPADTRGGR